MLFVRESVCRAARDVRFICEELRDREDSEETLPTETKLPSSSRGELGTNAVAEPFAMSDAWNPFCILGAGVESERMGEVRTGEKWLERTGGW